MIVTWKKCWRRGIAGRATVLAIRPAPKLEDQTQILRLLDAERVGISLSDEWQLHPEQSTSAIVVLNPRAKYFSV